MQPGVGVPTSLPTHSCRLVRLRDPAHSCHCHKAVTTTPGLRVGVAGQRQHVAIVAPRGIYVKRRALFTKDRSAVWLADEITPSCGGGAAWGRDDEFSVLRPVVIKESYMAKVYEEMAEDPLVELAALHHLSSPGHPHVVGLLDYYRSPDATILSIVQPYVPGGDLLDCVNRNYRGRGMPEDTAREVLRQMVHGLLYLKQRHLAHGDLSPENVALEDGRIVLLDLGMCRFVPPTLPPGGLLPPTAFRGKRTYTAPELFFERPFDPWAADIFSLGATLYMLLLDTLFWDHAPRVLTVEKLRARVARDERGRKVPLSHEVRGLLIAMLHPDLRRRPTLEALLYHPWMHRHTGSDSPAR